MKKREIWTIAGGEHTSKPRPCIIAQENGIEAFDTVLIMPITSFDAATNRYRIPLPASPETGLFHDSYIEVEKVSAVRKKYLGAKIGEAPGESARAVDEALAYLLGIGAAK